MLNDPPPYSLTDDLSNRLGNVNFSEEGSSSNVHKIVVGVDFGTTYTGVSWVSTEGSHVKTLDDVHCIRDWPGPGRDADYSWKTPSRIAYGDDNASSRNSWGYEVAPRMKSFSWMKLLLDPEQATRFDDPSLASSEGQGVLAKPPDKSAVDLCADFLREIATFAYQSLVRRLSAETLAVTPLEFWFTVPAVWSDKAKSDTLRAAQKAAKMAKVRCHANTQLFLIREPEAAAIATISALTQGGSQQQIKPGDSILICDCGGGTVDVTTYEIISTNPKLTFKELLVGTGGKCGSTYIDREFIKWMEQKFGHAYKRLSWEKKGPASRFMKEFESHKRDFGKSKDSSRYYDLQLIMKGAEDSRYYEEDSGTVKIYEDDLQQLFKPVVTKVIDLLQSQLDEERKQKGKITIKTVILVGGFGDSVYLNDMVRAWCKKSNIRLICPEHPQAAIVRGAALSGLLHIQPTSRRSRRHYGFAVHEAYDRERHSREDMFIWEWDGSERASGNTRWELAKGAVVDETTSINLGVFYTMYEDETKGNTVQVYCSDIDEAPDHIRSSGVKKLADFSVDFSGVDMSTFPSRLKNGRVLRSISCDYRIYFGGRRGVLGFSCVVGGKEVGNTTVTFDGQDGSDPTNFGGSNGVFSPPCAVQ